MRILAVSALVALLLVSGCASPKPTVDPEGGQVFQEGHSAPLAKALRLPLEEHLETTIYANGSVAFQDTCNTGGCLMGTERAFHATDITNDLPAGVPVEITVQLNAQPSQLFGMFDLFIDAPESTVYWYRQEVDHPAGSNFVQALLRPVGQVSVVMAAYAPGGGTTETPYTLSIGILADPERVSPGAPVGVQLGPNDNLTLQAPGQIDPPFLLYAPDDKLLGTFEGQVTLPPNAAEGEYAVLLPMGSQWGNLSTDNGETAMRALGLRIDLGPEATVPATGTYDGDWEVKPYPLAIGIFAYAPQTAGTGNAFLVSNGFTIRVEGPNGVRLDSGDVCNICITGGFSYSLNTGTGDPAVTAGTYSLHAETQATYDLRIVPYSQYLSRE